MSLATRRVPIVAGLGFLILATAATSANAQVVTPQVITTPDGQVIYVYTFPAATPTAPAVASAPASAPAAPAINDAAPPAPSVPIDAFLVFMDARRAAMALKAEAAPASGRGLVRRASMTQKPGQPIGVKPSDDNPPPTPTPDPVQPTPAPPPVAPNVVLLSTAPGASDKGSPLDVIKVHIQDADYAAVKIQKIADPAARKAAILKSVGPLYASFVDAPDNDFDKAAQEQKDELGKLVDEGVKEDGADPKLTGRNTPPILQPNNLNDNPNNPPIVKPNPTGTQTIQIHVPNPGTTSPLTTGQSSILLVPAHKHCLFFHKSYYF